MKFYEYIKTNYPNLKSTLALELCNKSKLNITNIHMNLDEELEEQIFTVLSKQDIDSVIKYMPESAPIIESTKRTYVPTASDVKIIRMPFMDALAIPEEITDAYGHDNDFCWVTSNLLQEYKRKGYVPVGVDGVGSEWLTVGDGEGIGKSILMMINKKKREEYLKAPVIQDYKNREALPKTQHV